MNKKTLHLSVEKITKLLQKQKYYEIISSFLEENGALIKNEEKKIEAIDFLKAFPLLIEKLHSLSTTCVDLENDEIPSISDLADTVRLQMNIMAYINFLSDLWFDQRKDLNFAFLIKSLSKEEQKEFMPENMEEVLEEQLEEHIKNLRGR